MNARIDDDGDGASLAAIRWTVRLASGEIDEAELAAFEAWLETDRHREAFDRQRGVWQALEEHEHRFANPRAVRAAHWLAPRFHWTRTRARIAVLATIAATIALVLFGPDILIRLRADHIADGAVMAQRLPDGSRMVLDGGSAVAVHYDRHERRVEVLRGAAWFEVRHNDSRRFRVAALGGVTEDVGTAFVVDRGAQDVTVAVTQGLVDVTAGSAVAPLRLKELGRVSYGTSGGPKRISDATASSIAPWRRGIIAIENLSVEQAIAEVARYRAGRTVMLADATGRPPVSAAFRADRSDEALRTLADMAGLNIISLPGGIIIIR